MKPNPLRMVAASLLLALFIPPMATAAEAQFTDDNWVSGHLPAPFPAGYTRLIIQEDGTEVLASGGITALATDEANTLYVAGGFPAISHVIPNGIAQWDGHAWSALGSGRYPSTIGPSSLRMGMPSA